MLSFIRAAMIVVSVHSNRAPTKAASYLVAMKQQVERRERRERPRC